MPEETDKYIRIPTGVTCTVTATITISSSKGIKALYCGKVKKIRTYLFLKSKGWTMEKAKKWVEDHKKDFSSLYAKGYVEKLSDADDGKLGLCIISSGTVDRQGDKLNPEGWDFKNFRKNPILLWSHNAGSGERRPPIGKVEDLYVKDEKVYFTPVFDLEDKFAKEIYRKYKNKYLNAFSVGFLPLEWTETETGYNFEKQEALEFSAVNVPANPEALVVLRDAGIEVSKDWKEWKDEGGLAGEDPNEEEDSDELKGVISYKKHPTASEDTAWNGPKEVAQAEVEDLKVMCAWVDSENSDKKSAYKLPHHRSNDKYTVWNGVRAAMAALFGARGGVNIPEKDWNGVYNHLAKHYKDFDKEPPTKKHFETALWKVAAGKSLKKKAKTKDSDLLIKILKLVAREEGR